MAIKKETKIALVVLLLLVVIATIPLLAIWCINTLFPVANLAYSFINWFAMFLLIAIFSGGSISTKD